MYENQAAPQMVKQIGDYVTRVSCGDKHTIVLVQSGLVYAMGSNTEGQLGLKKAK